MGTLPPRHLGLERAIAAIAARAQLPPLFRALPPDELVTLIRSSRGVTGRRGDRIAPGSGDRVTLILDGVAAGHAVTEEGDRLVRGLYGPGDLHGLTATLGHPEIADELIAVEPVDALSVPAVVIHDLIRREATAARACLEMVAKAHAGTIEEMRRFAASTTAARVEARLVELAERFGQKDGDRVVIRVALTQEELASWAHTSRESTAKVLQALRRAGILTTGRRQLVIDDLDALRARQVGTWDPTVEALLRFIS
jgi:CRP/FNR family transcriptional regulator, cyclic AMP receptor protein